MDPAECAKKSHTRSAFKRYRLRQAAKKGRHDVEAQNDIQLAPMQAPQPPLAPLPPRIPLQPAAADIFVNPTRQPGASTRMHPAPRPASSVYSQPFRVPSRKPSNASEISRASLDMGLRPMSPVSPLDSTWSAKPVPAAYIPKGEVQREYSEAQQVRPLDLTSPEHNLSEDQLRHMLAQITSKK